MESELKQVIVVRKDLNMRKGKMIAQGAHASMAAIIAPNVENILLPRLINDERVYRWLEGKFTKIALQVNSEEELLSLYQKAKDNGFLCSLITDSGLTEFNGVPTNTAIAIGPDERELIDALTGELKLL